MQEMRVQSLGREDALEKEMATHPSVLAWEIPWTEEPSRLQSMGLQKSQIWLSDWAEVWSKQKDLEEKWKKKWTYFQSQFLNGPWSPKLRLASASEQRHS